MIFQPKLPMKKVLSLILAFSIIMSFMITPVFANSYANNYKEFRDMNKVGELFSPNSYSKTKTVNALFIEEFYEHVFFEINTDTLRPYNEIETTSMTEELKDFFEDLNAGDIIQVNEDYSIFLTCNDRGVTLYDVGTEMSGVKDGIISSKTYSYSQFSKYAKYITAYQPNGNKDYDILEEQEVEKEADVVWYSFKTSGSIKMTVGDSKDLSIAYEKNSGKEKINGDYTYSSSNPEVAYIKNGVLYAKEVGSTTLIVNSKSGKYPVPENNELKVTISSKSQSDTKTGVYWNIPNLEDNDILYLSSNSSAELVVMMKENGVYTDVTSAMKFTIEDDNILEIKNGYIYPIKTGETTITAKSKDKNISSPGILTVKVNKNKFDEYEDSNIPYWSIDGLSGTVLNLSLEEEMTFKLFATKNGKKIDVTDDFDFNVRNSTIAYVYGHKIIAEKTGSTKLIAKSKIATWEDPKEITIIVSNEYLDEDKDPITGNDNDKREITSDSYYTYWRSLNTFDNVLTMKVGETINVEVYLQMGIRMKDVSSQIDMSTTDESVAAIKGEDVLVAMGIGTTTLKGYSRGNFAPHPPEITINVVENDNLSKGEKTPIWTIDGMTGDRLAINISNYVARYITTGTVSETGLNDTTDYMTFDTKDHDIAIVKRDGTIEPVSVGKTILYATSSYAKEFVPAPLTIEVYENTGEDGNIFFVIDGVKPEVLRLSEGEEVPFNIFVETSDGSVQDFTEGMIDAIKVDGNAITIDKDGLIIGKKLGIATLSIDVTGYNFVPYDLPLEVRNLDINDIKAHFSYPDVPPSHWAYNYILELSRKKIVNGFEDGLFRPNDPVTLEQALKMIISVGENLNMFPKYTNGIYKEPELYGISSWAKPYVEAGSIYIDSTGAFSSGFYGINNASRIQIMSLLQLASGIEASGLDITKMYLDFKDIPHWGYDLVETMTSAGIIEGNDYNQLLPNAFITRAEMSKMLYETFFMPHKGISSNKIYEEDPYEDEEFKYNQNKNNSKYNESYNEKPENSISSNNGTGSGIRDLTGNSNTNSGSSSNTSNSNRNNSSSSSSSSSSSQNNNSTNNSSSSSGRDSSSSSGRSGR